MQPVKYMCTCNAVKGDLNTGIQWNDSWENITESVSVMKRSLCDKKLAVSGCNVQNEPD